MTTTWMGLCRSCLPMRVFVRRTSRDTSTEWSLSALVSASALMSLHQRMKKPFASPLTFYLQICTLWMFTCQCTPSITPQTSLKTHTAPFNHPHCYRDQLPPDAQHIAPRFCLSERLLPSPSMRKGGTAIRAKPVTPSGTREEFLEGNACAFKQSCW